VYATKKIEPRIWAKLQESRSLRDHARPGSKQVLNHSFGYS
jgi:hypothetical protein